MKIKLSLVLIVAMFLGSLLRAVDAPLTVNYQGRLLNSAGASVADGTYTISFKIYSTASGSTFLWGQNASVVVNAGTFNAQLGPNSGSPIAGATYTDLSDTLGSTTTPYLGLTVTADTAGVVSSPQEIAPRLLFLSSAYAVVAHSARIADYAATATNATQLNGQSASSYFIPASTAASTISGPLTTANSFTAGGSATLNGTTILAGPVNLNGTLAIGTGGTTGGGFVPVGGILMWSGATTSIPAGWHLCDGTTGTPDLRDRFVVGAGRTYNPGVAGGQTSVTLGGSQIPDHKHVYRDTVWAENNVSYNGAGPEGLGAGADGGNYQAGSKSGWDWDNSLSYVLRTSYYARSGTTTATSSTDPVATLPPYYALAYIMRTN